MKQRRCLPRPALPQVASFMHIYCVSWAAWRPGLCGGHVVAADSRGAACLHTRYQPVMSVVCPDRLRVRGQVVLQLFQGIERLRFSFGFLFLGSMQ